MLHIHYQRTVVQRISAYQYTKTPYTYNSQWLVHFLPFPYHIEAETKWPPFPDDIFKCNFLNENILIATEISLKFVPKCTINNIPAMVQIMAWRRPGDKPLSEPVMVSIPTHICVTRPRWVKFYASTQKTSYKYHVMSRSKGLSQWQQMSTM